MLRAADITRDKAEFNVCTIECLGIGGHINANGHDHVRLDIENDAIGPLLGVRGKAHRARRQALKAQLDLARLVGHIENLDVVTIAHVAIAELHI